jgi:hypothetical protein
MTQKKVVEELEVGLTISCAKAGAAWSRWISLEILESKS